MSLDEQVMVITKELSEAIAENDKGVNINNLTEKYDLIIKNHSYITRKIAEQDSSYRQIIPYVIVTNGLDYLVFQRKKKQTEKRLHLKYSLGVGGHINPPLDPTADSISYGMYREFHEELFLNEEVIPKLFGFVYDFSVDVGKYHLGVAYIAKTGSKQFSLPEEEKMTAFWADKHKLKEYYNDMESWSQICYDKMISSNICNT